MSQASRRVEGPARSVCSLHEVVAGLLEDPDQVTFSRSILGTAVVEEIVARVEGFCRTHLGRGVVGCYELNQSVGSVFALRLDDGSDVVLKLHPLGSSRMGMPSDLAQLAAVYSVQAQLAAQGLPCARVRCPPVFWEGGGAAAMERLDTTADDARLPSVRQAMAESLADFVRRAEQFRALPHLPWSQLPRGRLFPPPHTSLFDFNLAGGEWIDERARAARAEIDALGESLVVAHADYSSANVLVRGARVTAIFDFDSVGLIDEMRCLAATALHFTYQPSSAQWRWATPEESIGFVADYQRARGRPLSALERRRLSACAIYAMGYTARCEHALDPAGHKPGGMREQLRGGWPPV